MNITIENINEFPIGSKVLIRCGAYYPDVEGVITKHEIVPATKHFDAFARVHIITEDNTNHITTNVEKELSGKIGTYLIETAEKKEISRKKSPWFKEEV